MSGRRPQPFPLSVAPMMDRTDRHFRYLLRGISRQALLYTEMITTGAVLHGNRELLLGFHPEERPLAAQLGGNDPVALAEAARVVAAWGYDEINLNVGCPSPRVAAASFGAVLMTTPEVVARSVEAIRAVTALPVTVKHRIGVDALDRYEDLEHFATVVHASGADVLTVHARKAWLSRLSPKQNREVPPLRYGDVYRLKEALPKATIELNGGIRSLEAAAAHLRFVDGVMMGRAVVEDPFVLAGADALVQPVGAPAAGGPSRREVVLRMLPYLEERLADGAPLHAITRHLLGLFRGRPGGKRWRRVLTEETQRVGAGPEVVLGALAEVPEDVLDDRPGALATAA